MSLAHAPVAKDGFFVTHFLTVKDQEKSKAFYVGVLGGKVVKPENPCYMRDPDGYIIEVGQYTQLAIEAFDKFNS
jgi:predicted enzyme related to lactoylglutathione lyase